MTDTNDQPGTDKPSPATALEAVFRSVLSQRMQDMPMLNPALVVEAVGFRPWADHWLGILITPWFMNLMLLPRVAAKWQPVAQGTSRHYVFPAGVFEFIGGHDPALGDYQACSLFSPMFEFANPQGAHDTAVASMAALFDGATREPGEARAAPAAADATAAGAAAPAPRAVSKRDFLFGISPRSDLGP